MSVDMRASVAEGRIELDLQARSAKAREAGIIAAEKLAQENHDREVAELRALIQAQAEVLTTTVSDAKAVAERARIERGRELVSKTAAALDGPVSVFCAGTDQRKNAAAIQAAWWAHCVACFEEQGADVDRVNADVLAAAFFRAKDAVDAQGDHVYVAGTADAARVVVARMHAAIVKSEGKIGAAEMQSLVLGAEAAVEKHIEKSRYPNPPRARVLSGSCTMRDVGLGLDAVAKGEDGLAADEANRVEADRLNGRVRNDAPAKPIPLRTFR